MPLEIKVNVFPGLTKEEHAKVIKTWDKDPMLRQRLGYILQNYINEYIAIREKTTPKEHNQD